MCNSSLINNINNNDNNNSNDKIELSFPRVLPKCQGLIKVLYMDHLIYHSQQPDKAGTTISSLHFIGMGAERLLNN